MARRGHNSVNIGSILVIALVVVAIAVVGIFVLNRKPGGFADIAQLPVDDFLENANSLRGNEYQVEGTIDERLNVQSSREAVSLIIQQDGIKRVIPVKIPSTATQDNIERLRKYEMKIRIGKGGVPIATEVRRL